MRFLILAATSFVITSVSVLAEDNSVLYPKEPKEFDRKNGDTKLGDGWLDKNELKEYEDHLKKVVAGTNDIAIKLDVRDLQNAIKKEKTRSKNPNVIAVARLAGYHAKSFACNPVDKSGFSREVYVVKDIIALQTTNCRKNQAGVETAKFSVKRDSVKNSTQVSLKGGVAIPLYKKFYPSKGRRNAKGADQVSGYRFLAFAEGDGALNANDADSGYARAGLNFELKGFHGPLGTQDSNHIISDIALYYQTDFALEASGYGLTVSVLPVFTGVNRDEPEPKSKGYAVNFAREDDNKRTRYFTGRFVLDGFRINDAGNTALTGNTDYLWFGGEVGGTYAANDLPNLFRNGYKLSLSGAYFRDVLSNRVARQISASATAYLNPEKNSTISLEYVRGRGRQTFTYKEEATLSFGLKF